MKFYKILLLAGLVTSGCTGILPSGPAESASQSIIVNSPSTKVALDQDLHTVWSKGDKVSVFYKSDINEEWSYDGADGAASGVISHVGTRQETSDDVVALYPYSEGAVLSGDVVRTALRPVQSIKNGSFDPEAALMVAKSGSDELQFAYAVGVIRFTLNAVTRVDSLKLRGCSGEPLCGEGTIALDQSHPSLSLSPGGTEITLKDPSGKPVDIDSPTDFFFCVAPVVFSKGYEIEVFIQDGDPKKLSFDRYVSLKAGHMVSSSASIVDSFVLEAVFSIEDPDGTLSKNIPFTSSPSSSLFGKVGGPFYLKEYPDKYPFYFYVSGTSDNSRLGINSSGSGLQIGGALHDYILLPAVEGRRLSRVEATLGQSSGALAVAPDVESGIPTPVKGGENVSAQSRATTTFILSETEPSKSYRLEINRDGAAFFIRKLVLTYVR